MRAVRRPSGAGRRRRPAGVAVVLVVTACAASACSSPSRPAASARTTTASSSTSGPSGTSPSTSPTAPTTVAGCSPADYALSLVGSQGAAGTFEDTFALRNTSAAPCPMKGYPGVQLLGAGGVPLPTDDVPGGTDSFTNFAAATVEVPAGGSAFFNMGYSDVPAGTETTCPTASALQVIPPGGSTALMVSGQFRACDGGRVTVSPVFGSGSPETNTTAPPG